MKLCVLIWWGFKWPKLRSTGRQSANTEHRGNWGKLLTEMHFYGRDYKEATSPLIFIDNRPDWKSFKTLMWSGLNQQIKWLQGYHDDGKTLGVAVNKQGSKIKKSKSTLTEAADSNKKWLFLLYKFLQEVTDLHSESIQIMFYQWRTSSHHMTLLWESSISCGK